MAEYYNIQEVMAKLRKSEEDVKGLVKEGRLRQYMDSGKAVFKIEDVDALAEEIVGLDISSFGETPPDDGTDLGIMLEETSEVELVSEETTPPQGGGEEDLELELEPDVSEPKESEGGFGLSQMGDITSADTNISSVGINILSGTGDAYKLTEDTKAETQAADIDELESLDGDSNLESFGSGSGLLDLSLQADDTSLGAVLDDILPTGAEGAGGADMGADEGVALLEEPEDLLSPEASAGEAPAEVTAPMGEVQTAPAIAPGAGVQMVAVAPVDPKSGIFGFMMFLPLLGMILAAIVLTAAIQGVTPSLVKTLVETEVAGFSLIWAVVAGLAVVLLILLAASAVGGGAGGGAKTKGAKSKKAKKEKKAKKPKKEKAPKKKKK